MFFKSLHKFFTRGLFLLGKDKAGGATVVSRRRAEGSEVVQALSGEKRSSDSDWGEVDVLLQNWQADVLIPGEKLPAVKLKPLSDEVLDNVLRTSSFPEAGSDPIQRIEVPEEIPSAVKKVRPAEKKIARKGKAAVRKKDPSAFRKGILPGDTALKFLRFRTDSDHGERPVSQQAFLSGENIVSCRICGTHVSADQLIDSMYCSEECRQFYGLCNMCHRPYPKSRKEQRFCSDPACQMRYARKPGIRKIEYVLIEE